MDKGVKIVLIIVGIIVAIILGFVGIYVSVNMQLKKQYETTNKLMEEAKNYAVLNKIYGEDIFNKLDKPKGVTDGIVYVNRDLEVSMAVVYDDVCYTKLYSSEDFVDFISPNACVRMVILDAAKNDEVLKPDDDNKDDEQLPDDEIIVDPDDEFESSYVNYDEGLESNQATSLYNKYVKYSKFDINAYSNINVNEDDSNEYMVTLAIYNILNDNNVNMKDYGWTSTDELEDGHSKGYKITTSQIENYINKLFDVNKMINYRELDLWFYNDISAHYYETEDCYRLIRRNSIPATGGGPGDVYSKYLRSEVNGDNIIVYSNYFRVVFDTGSSWVEDRVNDEDTHTLCYSTDVEYVCPVGDDETDVEYVLDNLSKHVGKFKHTFTKKSDGNYYWVNTVKVSN